MRGSYIDFGEVYSKKLKKWRLFSTYNNGIRSTLGDFDVG